MTFSLFGVFSIRLILWSYSLYSGNFLNFFLLNKYVNSQIYSSKSFRFIRSSSLPISCCPLFVSSIDCNLCVLDMNSISWCCILHSFRHLVNCIVPIFQFMSGLCLTNQSYPKNMSMLFKYMTTVSILSICPLISSCNLLLLHS